jgi:hypothetical protein
MAKGSNKITVEVNGVNITGTRKELDKLAASQRKASQGNQKLANSNISADRGMKGTANMSSNVSKNFSKMQQGLEGGGGSGGLVRAYALLAANVFALTAAFGILSRSAQIDTLTESIERLEVVSGKGIKSVARDLQEAAGFGLSFAESLRSVSLATSAGFGGPEIERLGAVAKNAAISLGRNLPDALDRIFRGVIKVEPELLDEIGLFVRVNEAASKYAADLGVAVGDLTEFQKRQAFLNEALEQGEQKFQVFEDIEIDAFAKLQTTFADLTQDILSFANNAITPLINLLAENKLIFTLIFTAVGTTLLRMAIPAMTQFTARTVENAVAARKAAAEQQKQSNAKIALINAEAKAQQALRRQQLETERLQIQKDTKTSSIGVGGRDASKRIEAALQKEIAAKGRLELVNKRIADIENPRGLKQREKNEEVMKELSMLKQEKIILEQIRAIDKDKVDPFTGPVRGKEADRTAIQTKIKAMTAERLANVQVIASNKGLLASLKQVGKEFTIVKNNIIATTRATGFFGKASANLRAGMFALKASAISLATSFQALWTAIMGPLTVFLMILPVLQAVNRFFGVGSEEAENLTNATKEMNSAMKLLPDRIEHVNEQMKLLGEGNFKAVNQGTEAFKNSIYETIQALDEQIKAFDEYTKNATGWAQFWGEKLPALFGGGTKRKIKRNTDEIIETIRAQSDMLTPEMKRLFAQLDAAALTRGEEDDNTARQAILDRQKEEAEGFKNIRSAIDGARDSARAFSNSLIVKTDVDKPLATFRQLNTVLESALLSEKERKNVLAEIANDTAILSLATEDQRTILKSINIEDKVKRQILQDIEDSYFRQQEVLIRQKQELAEIKTLQQSISSLTKVSEGAVDRTFQLKQQEVEIQREGLEFQIRSAEKSTSLTREEMLELSKKKTLLGNEKVTKENIAAVQAALNALQELENLELKQKFVTATEEFRLLLQKAEVQKTLLGYEESLNKEKMKQVELQAKIAQFSETGSTSLSPVRQAAVLLKQITLESSTLKQKEKIEKDIVKNKFAIMKADLQTMATIESSENAIINAKKKANKDQLRTTLEATKIALEGELVKTNLMFQRGRLTQGQFDITALAILDAMNAVDGQLKSISEETGSTVTEISTNFANDLTNLSDAQKNALDAIGLKFGNQVDTMATKLLDLINKLNPGSDFGDNLFKSLNNRFASVNLITSTKKDEEGNDIPLLTDAQKRSAVINMMEEDMMRLSKSIEETLGKDGVLLSALAEVGSNMIDLGQNFGATFAAAETGAEKTAAVLTAVGGALSGIQSIVSANAEQQVNDIDKLIDAEKRKDGKSKESVERIKQMEKQKEKVQRKAFEVNKKLMIAQAIASTASGIAATIPLLIPPTTGLAVALMAMMGTIGAAQVALISKLQFQGGSSDTPTAPSTALSIGSRSSNVDVSKQTTGGELDYLRGGSTSGNNLGGAGGAMGRKGYANGGEGIVVGERGPEIITPADPVDITPNFALGGETNVNFTINAVDATGVEDLLVNQRGNIIRMIREAANENGEDFLTQVDPMAYGSKS